MKSSKSRKEHRPQTVEELLKDPSFFLPKYKKSVAIVGAEMTEEEVKGLSEQQI